MVRDMAKKLKNDKIDTLAFCAARVLGKYGIETPDWDEWRDLKNALLEILPELSKETGNKVGFTCSEFNQELSKIIKQ